jgi:hypothetical protein
MSTQQRRELVLWLMACVGAVIMLIQLYRYATNTLSYTYAEMAMNVISVSLMIFPKFILNLANKILTKNE